MKNMIDKVVYLMNELAEIAEKNSFYINLDPAGRKNVHVPSNVIFFNNFDTYDIEEQSCSDYPYMAKIELDGVSFFTLLTKDCYTKYVLKSA